MNKIRKKLMVRVNLNTHSNATKMQQTQGRVYSRHMLGATLTLNQIH